VTCRCGSREFLFILSKPLLGCPVFSFSGYLLAQQKSALPGKEGDGRATPPMDADSRDTDSHSPHDDGGSSGGRNKLNCLQCRVGKKKCDRVQPVCERCQKLGTECTYPDGRLRPGQGVKRKNVRELEARVGMFDENPFRSESWGAGRALGCGMGLVRCLAVGVGLVEGCLLNLANDLTLE
jgi:hypothetical protein